MDTNTQVPQAGAEGSDQSMQTEQQNTIPQERFNEIVAKANQAAELVAQMQATVAQQNATIAQLQSARQAAPQEQAPEMDPEDQKKINWHVNQALSPVLQELRSLKEGLGQARSAPEIDRVEAHLASINNPAITARTRQLMAGLKQKGLLGTTYTPDEVLKQAIGEFSLGQIVNQNQNQNERAQYNGGGVVPLGVGSGAGGRGRAAAPQVQVLADKPLEQMSQEELAAFSTGMEKKYPGGLGF